MPYRPEGSLTAWLRQRGSSELPQRTPLHTQDVAHFIHQAADALQHAHDRQIIHQDVKPANFLIRSDRENPDRPDLLLADFGVAKITTATASASHSIRGTPAYMAPEQLDGHPVRASDQYALAVMAYELLTGRPPFQGSLSQVMYQHFQAQPPAPSTLNPQLPRDVDTVLLHALAKKPEDRFASISAFARAFQEALQGTDAPTIASIGLRNTPRITNPSDRSADVRATLAISDIEALKGTSRTLTLPGGRRVTVTVPAGAHDGQVIYLTDQGEIPSQDSRASLILTIAVTPTQQHPAIVPGHSGQSTVSDATTVFSNQSQNRHIDQSSPMVPLKRSGSSPNMGAPVPTTGGSMITDKRSGLPGSSVALLIGLALLVILVSLGAVLLLTRQNGSTTNVPAGQLNLAATANAATTAAQNNTDANATTQANANSTAQANANVNATATAQANPTSPPVPSSNPYPPNAGTLALTDPLVDNSKGYQWDQGTNSNNATCQFTANGLDVTQPKQGYFHGCIAHATDFTNFAYEVQMTMLSGDYAGIIFRADTTRGTYYIFYIKPTGDYALRTLRNDQFTGTLKSGSSTSIHTGLNATNLIAVVVQNGTITLYVNRTLIDSVSDSSYTHGAIGVFTGNDVNAAETVFSNAKVWSL
jgi:eukaryotic-like serine/threonine-protein kinase